MNFQTVSYDGVLTNIGVFYFVKKYWLSESVSDSVSRIVLFKWNFSYSIWTMWDVDLMSISSPSTVTNLFSTAGSNELCPALVSSGRLNFTSLAKSISSSG